MEFDVTLGVTASDPGSSVASLNVMPLGVRHFGERLVVVASPRSSARHNYPSGFFLLLGRGFVNFPSFSDLNSLCDTRSL